MIRLSLPLLLICFGVPAAYAVTLGFVRDKVAARRMAVGACSATLLLTLALNAVFWFRSSAILLTDPWPLIDSSSHALLGVDRLSILLLPIVALVSLLIVAAAPTRDLSPRVLRSLLLLEATALLTFTAQNVLVLALGWVGGVFAGLHSIHDASGEQTAARRVYSTTLVSGSAAFVAAVLWLAYLNADEGRWSFELRDLSAHGASRTTQWALMALLGLASLSRLAIAPLHGWLPTMFERVPLGVPALMFAAQPGAYALARFGAVFPTEATHAALPRVADLGLVSAALASLLGLAQPNLRRLIGTLAVSYSGLMLVGLTSTNAEGLVGGLLQSVASGLALTGLALVVWGVDARVQTSDAEQLGGLASRAPRLSAAFLVFGIATVGFPATISFVSEDMLIHGVVEAYPHVAAIMLIATVLNGISVLRAYTYVFLGEPKHTASRTFAMQDAVLRERLAYIVLTLTVVVAGVAPAGFVRSAESIARKITSHTSAGMPAAD